MELNRIVAGRAVGRPSAESVTLFKSLGMALWDVAAAKAVYDMAVADGSGKTIQAGWGALTLEKIAKGRFSERRERSEQRDPPALTADVCRIWIFANFPR